MHPFDEAAARLDEQITAFRNPARAIEDFQSDFQEVVRNRLYQEPLHRLLKRVSDYHTVPGSMVSSQRCILRKSEYSLWSLSRLEKLKLNLEFAPVATLKAIVGNGTALSRFYKLDDSFVPDEFNANIKCELVQELSICSESMPIFANGTNTFIELSQNSQIPAYVVSVICAPISSLVWEIERESMRPVCCRAMSGIDSGLETVIDFLAALKSPKSESLVARLTEHPRHFVRWKALKASWSINPTTGVYHLSKARNDPHPHIRAAAALALSVIDQGKGL